MIIEIIAKVIIKVRLLITKQAVSFLIVSHLESILCKPNCTCVGESVNTRIVDAREFLILKRRQRCENCTKLEVSDKSTSLVFFCAARNHMPAVCSLC